MKRPTVAGKMSTTTMNGLTAHHHHETGILAKLGQTIGNWNRQQRLNKQLARLNDHLLKDAGIDHPVEQDEYLARMRYRLPM